MPKHRPPTVAIIGAGIGGITMGMHLRRAGFRDFTIFEAEEGVGGTWRVNNYPGAGVDTPSLLYQFADHLQPWLSTHAERDDLLAYLENVVEREQLLEHVRLRTPIQEVRWDDENHRHTVCTADGEELHFDVVVSCLGLLNVPNLPRWPGLETFSGDWCHTAQWNPDIELTGKRVAVVGVGSSSVQVVPAIQPAAAQVTVYQRQPGWILPQGKRLFTDEEMARRSDQRHLRWLRLKAYAKIEWAHKWGPIYYEGSRRNQRAEATARAFINRVFADRPDLREAVTPTYAFSGKRRVVNDDFYPTLLKENVQLIPHAVSSITPTGIVSSDGVERPADVIVAATGFEASRYLARLRVFGANGADLHEVWTPDAFALAGMTVPGFPNFYIFYGPNTNGSGQFSQFWKFDQHADWVVRDLRRMVRHRFTAIETSPRVTARYNDWLQRRLAKTPWGKVNNYMKSESGRVVTQYAGSPSSYWLLSRTLRLIGTRGRREPIGNPPPSVGKPATKEQHAGDSPGDHQIRVPSVGRDSPTSRRRR